MFVITCPQCQHRHLVGPRSVVSFANSEHGPVATVRCPEGHLSSHSFRRPASGAAVAPGADLTRVA